MAYPLSTTRTVASGDTAHVTDHNTAHGKLNAWIDPAVDFGMDPDAVDNSTALQNAIDEAHSADNLEVGVVDVPPGNYKFTDVVEWKNCHIKAAGPNSSVRFLWDGADGATFLTKSGSTSWELLEGINFRTNDGTPAIWVDLTVGSIDALLRLRDLHFVDYTTAAIDVASWTNLNWQSLRFDCANKGGWSIRLTPAQSQNLSSFRLGLGTYDHSATTSPAEGFIQVDNSANASNLGTFVIEGGGRVEVNQPWTGVKAFVSLKLPDSSPNARSLGLHISDVPLQISSGGGVVLYRDTADINGSETLKLTNFRSQGLTEILGGSWPASFPRPVAGHYMDHSIANSGYHSLVHRPGFAVHPSASTLGSVTNKVEVFDEDGASLGFLPVYDAIT